MCAGEKSQLVWFSKSGSYEKPYCVKGAIQPAGSKQKPKGICKDRIIGTRKGIGPSLAGDGKQAKNDKLLNRC